MRVFKSPEIIFFPWEMKYGIALGKYCMANRLGAGSTVHS